jgi:hypothetical protein
MVSMHQPLSCLPKRMYMATTRIGRCVEITVLSIGKLSPISMPCLHLRRSLMLWDMRRSSVHLIFEQGIISCQEEDKAKTAFWGVNSHGKNCLY